jgi:hypothetical protein
MKLTFTVAGILIITFCLAGSVNAGDMAKGKSKEAKQQSGKTIKIASDIPFGKTTKVRESVRKECNLGGKLSDFIKQYGSRYDLNIEQSPNMSGAHGKVLHVEIVNVQGYGGGAWSGPKSVAIKGTLTENGKKIGTFHGSRHSGGGLFGGFKNTCAILGRCVKALGKDVSQWLKSPTPTASLGDG